MYEIPYVHRKLFSPEQCTELVSMFKHYDKDHSRSIDPAEFKQVLHDMGHTELTDAYLNGVFAKVDRNSDGVVTWDEFLQMMQHIKLSGQKRKSEQIDLKGLGPAEAEIGQGGSQSTYLREEVSVLTRLINNTLRHESAISERLPIDPDGDDLFDACADGLVLIYLLKQIDPALVNMKQVAHGANLNPFVIRNNLALGLRGAKKIIHVVGIDGQTFLDKTPHLVLGVLWQLIKYLQAIKVSNRLATGQVP